MTEMIIGITFGSVVAGLIYQVAYNLQGKSYRADIAHLRESYEGLNKQRLLEIELFKKEIEQYEKYRQWFKTHVCQIIKNGDMVKKAKPGAK